MVTLLFSKLKFHGGIKSMRVLLGRRIYLCTVATHPKGSHLILLTTSNGVYTVEMKSAAEAEECHNRMLKMGYYDFSGREYSN